MIEVKNIKASKEKNIDAIYIHIPFCSKKCEYCDFCTFVRMEEEYRKYTDYLIKEIRMYPKIKYDTIYFGGGTPSLLPVEMISEILNELDWSKNAEITLELNPTDMTFEKLKKIRESRINRLSIGIQSFQNHVLKFIGRQHSSEDAINVYKMARKAGFSNITVDLMFGIPNQSLEDLQRDLDILQGLKPENVSIYSLIWEEGTVFWSKLQKGILSEIDQDLEAEMYEKIIDFFEKNGYCQYEISNFARIDDKDVEIYEMANFEDLKKLQKNAGRHNLKYWQNQKFVGVGMSAASYFDNNRYSNIRTFEKYYNLIDEKNLPIDKNTIEIVDEVESEKLKKMLGLRLIQEGIEYFEDEKIIDFFEKNGYCQYEISNFARIDDKDKDIEINEIKKFEDLRKMQKNAGRHNLKYWRNQKFIGVGMSAASYFDDNRHSNVRTFKKYYNLIDDEKFPIDENTIEKIDDFEKEKLKKMLGLRLIEEGVNYSEKDAKKVEKLIKNGLIEEFFIEKNEKIKFKNKKNFVKNYEKRIKLTKKGLFLANNVFVEFI